MDTKIVSKFLKYNIALQPLIMCIGLIGSILAVRLAGPEYYSTVVTFYTSYSLMLFIFSLGSNPTIIRFYNGCKDCDAKNNVLSFVLFLQLFVFVLVVIGLFLLYGYFDWLKVYDEITIFLMACYIPLAAMSALARSYLTAKLENKIYLSSELARGVVSNLLIIFCATFQVDVSKLLFLLFFSYLLCEIPVIFSLRKFNFFKALLNIKKVKLILAKDVSKYFFSISMVRFSKICFELPFIVLLLNISGDSFYIAFITICYRVLAIQQKIIQLPVDRLLPSLLSKSSDDFDASKIMSYSFKYYRLVSTFFCFISLLLVNIIIYDIYQFERGDDVLSLLIVLTVLIVSLSPSNSFVQMRLKNFDILKISLFVNVMIIVGVYFLLYEPYLLVVFLFLVRLANNAISTFVISDHLSEKIVTWIMFFSVNIALYALYYFLGWEGVFFIGVFLIILLYRLDPVLKNEYIFIKGVLKF